MTADLPAGPVGGPSQDAREVCHDLRQPVAAALALVGAVQSEPGLTAPAQERLQRLHEQLSHLSGIVSRTLEPAEPTLVGLASLARDACRAGTGAPPELVVEAEAVVTGDPVQLHRVLDNLLRNARRAAGRAGVVRLTVSRQSDQAVLVVEDSGAGLGADAPSSGLGLLIVAGILRRHAGQATTGRSELGGLRVEVRLPLGLPVQPRAGAR